MSGWVFYLALSTCQPVSWADDDHYQICRCYPVKAVPAIVIVDQKPQEVKYELI